MSRAFAIMTFEELCNQLFNQFNIKEKLKMAAPFEWIDTHTHLARDYSRAELEKFFEGGHCKGIWLHSIECFKNSPRHCGNDEVLKIAKLYPEFVHPFAYCRAEQNPDQIRMLKDAGFTGLKFIDPLYNYDDPRFFPFYAEAEKLNMPCYFHVGCIAKKPSSELAFPGLYSSPGRMKPAMLCTIAAEFPKLSIIAGHPGVPWSEEMTTALWYYPNIRCTISALTDYKWFIDALAGGAWDGVPFYEKFMFGTDFAYGIPITFDMANEFAIFYKIFFREAGKTMSWGRHNQDFMINNARKVLENLS